MASPFSIFRKHQKASMAAVGILCMVAFTILPLFLGQGSSASGGPQGPNEVVARTNEGEIRRHDLYGMQNRRNLANSFMRETVIAAFGEQFRGQEINFFGHPTEESLIEAHLLAEKAAGLGVVISDSIINRFLEQISMDNVTADEFRLIVKRLDTSQAQVFDALRTELAAAKLRQMMFGSALFGAEPVATPGQRWDYYKRLNSRATIELIAIRVVNFIDQVEDPSPETLRAFFDAYKDQLPVPGSPDPGFKVPYKAAFQYLKASYEDFYDEKAVTQEAIEQYYEEHKDTEFLYSSLDSSSVEAPLAPAPSPGTQPPSGDAAPADPAAPGEEATDEGTGEATEESTEEAAPDPASTEPADTDGSDPDDPATDEDPADEEPVDEQGADEEPADEKPAGEEPAGSDDSSGPDEPAASGDTSETDQSNRYQSSDNLLALYLPQESNATDSDPQAQSDAAQADGTEPVEAEASDVETSDAGSSQADESNAAEAPTADSQPAARTTQETGSSDPDGKRASKGPVGPPPPIREDLLLPRDVREGPDPKYDPLWKVEDSIRKRLAGETAAEKIDQALDGVKAQMDRYERRWTSWSVHRKGAQPAMPEFESLAAAQSLSYAETSMVSPFEVAEAYPELGSSKLGNNPFAAVAFDRLPKFRSVVSLDEEGNRYLVWKVRDAEGKVPELKDVREQVVRAWKVIQAREPARKKAAELVAKARRNKKPLAEQFAGDNGYSIIEPPSFSWLTVSSAADSREMPRLSEVEGVEDAGEDFMRQVFSLQEGQVGSAMNQPQNVVYVIRVSKLEPSLAALRELFFVYPFSLYQSTAAADQQEVVQAWIEQVKADAGLEWVQPADSES